jgi:hypothetical protein
MIHREIGTGQNILFFSFSLLTTPFPVPGKKSKTLKTTIDIVTRDKTFYQFVITHSLHVYLLLFILICTHSSLKLQQQ